MGNLQNQYNVYILNVDKPQNPYRIRNLQFQPATKGPLSKIRNLHWAYPCRHLGCPKKWFWRTPGGPDNGVGILGGIKKNIRIYSACSWLFLLLLFYSSCTLQYAKRLHHVSLVQKMPSFPRLLHNSTSIIILWKACNFRLKSLSQLLLLLLSSSAALKNLISLVT